MAYMTVALEAGDDPGRTAELEGDLALKVAAEPARDAISDTCSRAAKVRHLGLLWSFAVTKAGVPGTLGEDVEV